MSVTIRNSLKDTLKTFSKLNPQFLFVSRYPFSSDLVDWLALIPNPYIHFGDFDPEGIMIFQFPFKKALGKKSLLLNSRRH